MFFSGKMDGRLEPAPFFLKMQCRPADWIRARLPTVAEVQNLVRTNNVHSILSMNLESNGLSSVTVELIKVA